MAISFPELGKTTVHIGIGGGKWIECPMLTMADMNEFQKIQLSLAKLAKVENATVERQAEELMGARVKCAEIACKVLPSELHERVRCMDYQHLVSLVNVLCTGDDESDKDEPEKKVVLPSQLATS